MDVILAILLVTAINVGAADRALADLTGKCGYYTNTREQQVLHLAVFGATAGLSADSGAAQRGSVAPV